jgi:hypothetical protein
MLGLEEQIMNCPECSHEFEVSVFATIPERQTLYMKLTSEGELFNAKTIGEAMINLAQVQIEIAKAMGEKVQVMLQSCEVKPNEVTIGFCIAEHIKKPLPKELKDAVAQITAQQYIKDKAPVRIIHTDETGQKVYAVEVVGSDEFWLTSEQTLAAALAFVGDHKLPLVAVIK